MSSSRHSLKVTLQRSRQQSSTQRNHICSRIFGQHEARQLVANGRRSLHSPQALPPSSSPSFARDLPHSRGSLSLYIPFALLTPPPLHLRSQCSSAFSRPSLDLHHSWLVASPFGTCLLRQIYSSESTDHSVQPLFFNPNPYLFLTNRINLRIPFYGYYSSQWQKPLSEHDPHLQPAQRATDPNRSEQRKETSL